MAEVVSLRGEPIVGPGEPNVRVVGLAEAILERARSGELQGLSAALYHADDTHSRALAGAVCLGVIGNLERLKALVFARMDE